MSHSRGDFGYGSTSSTEFGDRRPLVADPRGNCYHTVLSNGLCLWHSMTAVIVFVIYYADKDWLHSTLVEHWSLAASRW